MLSTDGFRTLANVIINRHQFHMRDLAFGVISCHGMAATMAAQVKKDFTTISTQQAHFFSLL
jgi:ribulose-5-phosphate 4-epimerase/fuculose-1-phosphate aldolase